VDGIGWEAIPSERLDAYFQYIKQREDSIWVATFGDVTKYMRERKNAKVQERVEKDKIIVTLNHSLDSTMYTLPLTLKTYVPSDWASVVVRQEGKEEQPVSPKKDQNGTFVFFRATPNAGPIELRRGMSAI